MATTILAVLRSAALQFLLLTLLVTSCSPGRKQAEEHYAEAQAALAVKNDSAATLLLERAVKLDANYSDAWNLLGQIYYRHGKYNKAAEAFNGACTADPESYFSQTLLGSSLGKMGQYSEAASAYEIAVKYIPEGVNAGETYVNLAASKAQTGEIEQALEHYKTGIAMLSSSPHIKDRELIPEAYFDAANMLAAAGALKESLPLYRTAADLRPNFAEAMYFFGFTFNNLGMKDSAEFWYREAIKSKPTYSLPYSGLGKFYREKGEIPIGNNYLGIAEAYNGDYNKAIIYFINVLHQQPNHAEAALNAGLCAYLTGKHDEAKRYFQQAAAKRTAATALHMLGQLADADSNKVLAQQYTQQAKKAGFADKNFNPATAFLY